MSTTKSSKKRNAPLLPKDGKEYAVLLEPTSTSTMKTKNKRIVVEVPRESDGRPTLHWHDDEGHSVSMSVPLASGEWVEWGAEWSVKKALRFDGTSFHCEEVVYVVPTERRREEEGEGVEEEVDFNGWLGEDGMNF